MPNDKQIIRKQRNKQKKKQLRINQALKRILCKNISEASCRYCNEKFPVSILTIEHIIPLSLGGTNDFTNIDLACKSCNFQKGRETYLARCQQQKLEDQEKYYGKQGVV